MIEENLSPEERWQRDEKNRLGYQNYCNKIIQGLEELDENSGERALWELIQSEERWLKWNQISIMRPTSMIS